MLMHTVIRDRGGQPASNKNASSHDKLARYAARHSVTLVQN